MCRKIAELVTQTLEPSISVPGIEEREQSRAMGRHEGSEVAVGTVEKSRRTEEQTGGERVSERCQLLCHPGCGHRI